MERRFKKDGGITLIALIITIIIMLILVAVSVNFLIKSNLIGAAEKTAKGYKTAQEKENEGGIVINGKRYASVEDYITGLEEKHNWQYTDATRGAIRCTCEECKAFNDGDSEGRTLEIGTQIGKAEIINSSVTVTAEETGLSEDQTITASGIIGWVVLGYEDQNKNGTNETLLLTIAENSVLETDSLCLVGAAAYNNAIDTEEKDGVITKVCKGLFGTKARSMKIEDVNRAMGYDETPNGMQLTVDSSNNITFSIIKTTENKNKKLNELGDTWTAIKTYNTNEKAGVFWDPKNPNGIADEGAALGEYEVDGYWYTIQTDAPSDVPVVDSNISSTAKSLIFGSSNNLANWLASRGVIVYVYDGKACAGFGLGIVGNGNAFSSNGYYPFFGSNGGVDGAELPVHPVVSLTSFDNTLILNEMGSGERASETSRYQTAVVPKGFTVSGISTEQSIENGLVIYDIPEGTTVDWTNPDSVRTAYNQFVWIPVEDIYNFRRSVWQNNERVETGTLNSSTFPSNRDGIDTVYWNKFNEPCRAADSETGITSQIEELIKSIFNYGGFWIGRYEAGSKVERTDGSAQNDLNSLVIQQDKYPYNYIKWGTSMENVSTEGVVYLCNNLYNNSNYGAKSMLCTGAAWDSMLDFIKDDEHDVTNSNSWGNHYYTDAFTINRGSYAVYSYSNSVLSSFEKVNESSGKTVGSYYRTLLTTGASERNSNKNLYDIAGNLYEWTTEAYDSDCRVNRGGVYDNYASTAPAAFRGFDYPDEWYDDVGFRPILLIEN